jgi:hypothetical protein
MKRSYLLAKIQEYLDHNDYYDYYNSAESILEIIEEAGMLPPRYNFEADYDYEWEDETES